MLTHWERRSDADGAATGTALLSDHKMSGNKKRKLEEEAAAAASDGEVHAIDSVEVHVVTFRAPEFHLDASESAMLRKSALAPTHSKLSLIHI